MTRSGILTKNVHFPIMPVLIPLLVDDPLWDLKLTSDEVTLIVLIPLLVDDPLWAFKIAAVIIVLSVLIPLLVDDPLWDFFDFPYRFCSMS